MGAQEPQQHRVESPTRAALSPVHPSRTAPSALNDPFAPLAQPLNPFQLVHRRLIGRWRLALLVGGALGILFMLAGWLSGSPAYTARGYLEVGPGLPLVVTDTYETRLMGDGEFGQFLGTQAAIVNEFSTLERAAADPSYRAWHDERRLPVPAWISDRAVTATAERGTTLVSVTATDRDPALAAVTANAVLNTAALLLRERELVDLEFKRTRALATRQAWEAELQAWIDQRSRMLQESLGGTMHSELLVLDRAEQISALRRRAEALRSGDEATHHALDQPLPSELDAVDPSLPRLRDAVHRATLEAELEDAADVQRGVPPRTEAERLSEQGEARRHRESRAQLQHALDVATRAATEQWRAGRSSALVEDPGDALAAIDREIARLRAEIDQLNAEHARIENLTVAIDAQRLRLDLLNGRIMALDALATALEQGRFQVAAPAAVPSIPTSDSRRKLALAGLVGGFALGVGAVFLLACVDRRAFHPVQLDGFDLSGTSLIGVVDRRSASTSPGPDAVSRAVHQLRNRIELEHPHDHGVVVTVIGVEPDIASAHLANSLGRSYAAADYRTQLVDGALHRHDLSALLHAPDDPGLRDILAGEIAAPGAARALGNGLAFIPVGRHAAVSAASVRPESMDAAIAALRTSAEVTVIDAGAWWDELGAALVARAADVTILVIRPGTRISDLEACAADLRSLNARCLGVVFEATAQDRPSEMPTRSA